LGQAEKVPALSGEHRLVGLLAGHESGKLAGKESRNWDGPGLMGLRCPEHDVTTDVGVSAAHVNPPPK
jgi:hypothetical protein